MIATTLYQIFHQAFLKRPVFIFYSRKEKERQTERERERNNTPTHRITESLFSSNRKFKPASFQNLQPPFYTYEQRLEQLENRLNGSEEGEEGADRSLARGRLKPRSKFWKRGWLRLHPTTGCQWCGIGSKGHATMRPRKAVSTRGGVSNQPLPGHDRLFHPRSWTKSRREEARFSTSLRTDLFKFHGSPTRNSS